MGLFEIEWIQLMCLIVVLQSHDWIQPVSCSQMGLIKELAEAGIYNCHGKDAGEICVFFNLCKFEFYLCGNNASWVKIDICIEADNIYG